MAAVDGAPAAGSIRRAWWVAARPRTLPLAAAPVVLGSALAFDAGGFRALPASAALLGALLLQVGANFANDVFDAEKGADREDRIGPPRAVAQGWISPRAMRAATFAVLGLAVAVGAYLVAVGGWPVVAIGVLSIAAALAYTGGPLPLGYHGLGDVAVFLFFGPLAVGGSFYVQTLSLSPVALVASLPVGALATAVLVVNNVRDAESDRRAGKRTLAVRFGRAAGVAEYVALQALALAVPVALVLAGRAPALALLPLLTLPEAWRLLRVLRTRRDGPSLNGCLAGTARLGLVHALLFAGGWCV